MYSQIKTKLQFFLSVILFVILSGFYFVLPKVTFAALTVCGGHELPNGQGVTQQNINQFYQNSCQLSQIFQLIARVTNYLVGFAGIFAVVLIVMAGFRMVISAGNEKGLKEARGSLQNAVIGFLIVMIAYIVVNTVFMVFEVKLGISSSYQFPFNPFQ